MGNCLCIRAVHSPDHKAKERHKESKESACTWHSQVASSRSGHSVNSRSPSNSHLPCALLPASGQLLQSARAAVKKGGFKRVEPEAVCALALAASGGIETAESWCDDIAETRLGVCQMTLSTAQLLASDHSYSEYGTPSKETLLQCGPAMYFAAACINELSNYDGIRRGDAFTVKAFFAGPKAVSNHEHSTAALSDLRDDHLVETTAEAQLELLWLNYKAARRHIARLTSFEVQAEADLKPMHVVQSHETLASIAKACQVTGQELRKMNPDLPLHLQCGDCIALPQACLPRLCCSRRGDTWSSLGSNFNIPPTKLRLNNPDAVVVRHGTSLLASLAGSARAPDLKNLAVLLAGQLIEVPGLGDGSSVCSDDSSEGAPLAPATAAAAQWSAALHSLQGPPGGPRQAPLIVGNADSTIELHIPRGMSREITEVQLE